MLQIRKKANVMHLCSLMLDKYGSVTIYITVTAVRTVRVYTLY
jgi:hypothetical protein